MLHIRSVLGPARVLGIDPGSRVVGWGVVEPRGGGLVHVAHGVLRLDASAPLELRLVELFARLSEMLQRQAPTAVAVEGVFTFKNARSALVLGQARGVALLVAARSGLPVFEYAPALVKRAMGVGGAGAKEAVARAVSAFLGLTDTPRADATDALAVAVCHLHRAGSPFQRQRGRRAAPDLSDRLRPAVVRPTTAEIGRAGREDRAAIADEAKERGGRGARVPKPTSDAGIGREGKRGPISPTGLRCRSGA